MISVIVRIEGLLDDGADCTGPAVGAAGSVGATRRGLAAGTSDAEASPESSRSIAADWQ
jgi:hypothetical protein